MSLNVVFVKVYYKFKHNGAKKKNKYRRQLQKFEYLWGVARTAESGLEACFQVWYGMVCFLFLGLECRGVGGGASHLWGLR